MSERQKDDLRLLDFLTSGKPHKIRYDAFLGAFLEDSSSTLRPEEWTGGWCAGWAYPLCDAFADNLDLRLRPKKVKKIPVKVWGQGSAFSFTHGMIQCPPEIMRKKWGDFPPEGITIFKIEKGIPAEPAVAETKPQPAKDGKPAVPGKPGTPRDPGKVEITVWRNEPGKIQLVKVDHFCTTQDDFVRFLITGDRASIHEFSDNSFVGVRENFNDVSEEDYEAERALFLDEIKNIKKIQGASMSEKFTFEVLGSSLYRIAFEKKTTRVHVSCSCPSVGHCKHIAEIFRDARDESVTSQTGLQRVIDKELWPEIVEWVKKMDLSQLDEMNQNIDEIENEIQNLKNRSSFLKQKRAELFDKPEHNTPGKGFPLK